MNLNALYGKLSVFGNSIVYYDILFSAGVGENKTETGSYLTPNVGVGEKIYLSRVVALSVDYRLLYFKENVTDLPIKNRTNFTQIFWLGFDFLIGG